MLRCELRIAHEIPAPPPPACPLHSNVRLTPTLHCRPWLTPTPAEISAELFYGRPPGRCADPGGGAKWLPEQDADAQRAGAAARVLSHRRKRTEQDRAQ